MAVSGLFAIIALLGLIVAALDYGAMRGSPAPSMYHSNAAGWGIVTFIIAGLISAAAFADAY